MLYVSAFFPAVVGMHLYAEVEASAASTYPDLEGQDIKLVEEYLKAYQIRQNQPEKYMNARSKVLDRMRQLQLSFDNPSKDQNLRLKILAKLVDLNQLMRATKVAPQYFSSPIYKEDLIPLRNCDQQGLSAEIPEAVKEALDISYKNINFLDYAGRHVRHAYFVPWLRENVLILNFDRWTGTSEEVTRSIIIDNFDDERKEPFKPWMQAAAMVHEAAHIDYFYRYGNDPDRQEIDRVERYAYIIEMAYIGQYLICVEKDDNIPLEDKKETAAIFNGVLKKIEGLNQRLGFSPSDHDTRK